MKSFPLIIYKTNGYKGNGINTANFDNNRNGNVIK